MATSTHGRRLVVEADGGSRGNPGVAGYGALVRDAELGTVLAERAAPLGKRSNNVAEYSGLIAGLESAVTIDPSAFVEVRMDSKLVIEQMAGRWKIKHEDMRTLALEARELVRRIQSAGGSVSWTWIPRERNKAADKLSNDGMDGLTIDRMSNPGGGLADHEADVEPASGPVSAVHEQEPTSSPLELPGPARVWLVRHGATPLTAQNRLSGRGLADPSLDDAGRLQSRRVAGLVAELLQGTGMPESTRVVTSSLARARETGASVAKALGVDAEVDEDWDEQGFGYWDGLTVAQIQSRWPQAWADHLDPDVDAAAQRPPGGESAAELTGRVRAALARATQASGDVVVVTSRRPILVVLAAALDLPVARLEAVGTDPGSVTAVEIGAGGVLSVPFVNRTGSGS
ncbi:MAG: bifunctional RNase H/acid phosphatase [Actinomycetota bacterium]|nr:bifunctional RNase H/acid phosphatase [Actinomycetota bacterium]